MSRTVVDTNERAGFTSGALDRMKRSPDMSPSTLETALKPQWRGRFAQLPEAVASSPATAEAEMRHAHGSLHAGT